MRADQLAQQMAERRERILAAAREIIGQRGYEALTMRDLARASRVTVPTVYNLIGSKEEVLFAAIEEQTARFEARLGAGTELAPAARLRAIVAACADEYLRMPRYYRSLLRLLFLSDAAGAMKRRVDRALSTPIGEALGAMQSRGEMAPWIELRPLRGRLGAHLQMTSIQWASGTLSDDGMRAAARYGAGLILAAACVGDTRGEFEAFARESQAAAVGQSSAPPKPTSASGASARRPK